MRTWKLRAVIGLCCVTFDGHNKDKGLKNLKFARKFRHNIVQFSSFSFSFYPLHLLCPLHSHLLESWRYFTPENISNH